MTNCASDPSFREGGVAVEDPPRLSPLPENAAEVDPELCLRKVSSKALIDREE